MAHPDGGHLPTRERTHHSQIDDFSSRLSRAPTLSPTEGSFSLSEDHEHQKTEDHKKSSFIRRRFASTRNQATKGVESRGPFGLRSLFCAPETLIDLIFVHGLGGDSIKTWCLDNNAELFWPQYWLPKESAFLNASVHSFGYDSDRASAKSSTPNLHDFGDLLYEELLTSPCLRQNSKRNPIILIGHSVGGLVAKKAYVRARQDRVHPELAERIRCIFFLATPHRGSDYTALLNGISKYSGITSLNLPREFTKDTTFGPTSQLINADFARFIDEVIIYSFCETLPTISGSSSLVVDKASAILGLSPINEHIEYLHANHRDICKFRNMNDSNYITLKNALATAVEDLLSDVTATKEQGLDDQLRTIREFLGISNLSEEHHEKLEGSCQWVEERQDFQSWINPTSKKEMSGAYVPSIFWVQAPPGAGKSVLATHIIAQLTESRLAHASYFFHFGKKAAQSLTDFLKAMAFQMAVGSAPIREKLAHIFQSGTSFDQDNSRAVWTKIFVGGIFTVPLLTPQYWVIDAIDECVKYSELFTFLKGTQIRFPFRICMTSRKLPETPRMIRQLEGYATTVVHIPEQDTMKDIELYVRNRITDVAIDEEEERQELARQILAKSNTSFLWVRLVMDELEGLYGYESIMQVLQGIPEGMFSYYERAVAELEENKRERHVAMAILQWVMLATRPLSISELSQALQLDIKVHLSSAKSAIEGLCGQFVSVDLHTGLVQPIHATAREFLLSEEAGNFRIAKAKGHETIALTCLRLLVSPVMQPPRHRRLLDQKRVKPPASALLDYAITQFSEHVFSASSESDQLLVAVDKFLITSVLTWIEHVGSTKEIHRLIRTAKNFKAYLDRRAKYHSPLNRHVNNIELWTTDLTRIASNFGRALNSNPTSVYFLIPPLCPTQSAVYRQFGQSPDGLALLGYQVSDWDDCIAHVQFEEKTAAAVSCGSGVIAIGTEAGKVDIYNHRSFQKGLSIEHGFPVDLIWFDPLGSFVATCSRKLVALWDLDGNLRWKARIKSRCIILTSSTTALTGVTQQGRSFQWDIVTGQLIKERSYTFQWPDMDSALQTGAAKAPCSAAISPDMDLIALVYRNSPICIFEFDSGSLIGWAIDDNNRAAEQAIFNPNPEVSLLLVAYNESHLALYDPWSGVLIESLESEKPVILTSITCSADGRTFAAMDILGHLRIWDFESLTLLYHILTPNHSFSLLSFTSDGLGLVSVFEHEMRVWAPSALVRKTIEEEASTSDQATVLPVTEGQFERFHTSKIRTLVAHPHLPACFAGNHSGEVVAYRSQDSYRPSVLYSHDGIVVKCVAVSNVNLIASADMHAKVQVWRLSSLASKSLLLEKLVFQAQFPAPICQILFDTSGQHLLVSTTESTHVYNLKDGTLIGTLKFGVDKQSVWKWFVAPNSVYSSNSLLLTDLMLLNYSVEEFPAPANIPSLSLAYPAQDTLSEVDITSISYLEETSSISVEVRQQRDSKRRTSTYLFTLPTTTPTEPESPLPPSATIPQSLSPHFIGFSPFNKRFIFIDHESWVCSSDAHDLFEQRYTQHFFVPEEYVSEHDNIPPVQFFDGDFAFCLHDKVVVVRNGLKFHTSRIVM
ncbi:NACHT and WD domain protein [Cucurbitaria berberidis CBS 394.84]|uniref:GPI inositol-deacylase n=1 Tax=Cucurbitaria berberidis CBS 394.84 TaxID=1168544 RepID=A0A9P4GV59_9PLEO|nr:NACHT and WD domain protein [Cucurbitaria berberidis CBS 394.84]KAF1851892.1 NACHT and WD domain protein [Cucurbitaria berberidis CBS 394.84]